MPENSRLDDEIARLTGALADFASRSAAMRRLLVIGEPAVPALIEALESPVEGVAWAAAKLLGDLGAAAASAALEKALKRPALKIVASEALARITNDASAAAEPATAGETPTVERIASTLSDEELTDALCEERVSCKRRRGGATFEVLLPGGRKQAVEMMLGLRDVDASHLVAFYTECGKADPARYEWALKTNLRIPFGAFAVREAAEGARMVMVDAYLRESATVHQLKRALEMLARRADAAERMADEADSN